MYSISMSISVYVHYKPAAIVNVLRRFALYLDANERNDLGYLHGVV